MSRHAISHISYMSHAAGIPGVLAATLLLADLCAGTLRSNAVGEVHEPAPQALHRGTI